LQRACDFLARREHSRKELRDKLLRTCDDEDLIEELLEKLSAEGLQSDARFTESFILQRISKGQGPLKIRQDLSQRGIDQDLIEQYLNAASINWLAAAEAARSKKFGDVLPADYQVKAKQSRFLYGRGFNSELINQLFK